MILKYEQFIKTIPSKKTFVLIGETLSYSFSSNIHYKILEEFGIDADYFYLELEKHELEPAIEHLKKYFAGANVTIPYKSDVIKYLDNVDETASRLSSVNTIHIENSQTFGYNTDIIGIYHSLSLDNIPLHNKKVALLGNGGTASVVCDILVKSKADFTIFGRNMQKLEDLKASIDYDKVSLELLENFDDSFDVIFNTTPMGMNKFEGVSAINDFKNAKYVFDCVYTPQITKFMDIAMQNNIKARNGLYMLYTQALFAQSIWNKQVDVTRITNIYARLSNELFFKRLGDKNIVLFGFMGCGKTTISKEIAKITGLPIIDTDDFIEKEQKTSISKIFEKNGQAHFRQLELDLSKKLKTSKQSIISVGGGFLLNDEIVKNLSDNSIFIFLDTPFDIISERVCKSDHRPLAKNGDLKQLFDCRYPIYDKINAIKIKSSKSPSDIAREIVCKI